MSAFDAERDRQEAAVQIGMAYARTIILLNAGAMLATITYLSTLTDGSLFIVRLDGVRFAMVWFMAGIGSILAAYVIGYLRYAVPPDDAFGRWIGVHVVKVIAPLALLSSVSFLAGVYVLLSSMVAAL